MGALVDRVLNLQPLSAAQPQGFTRPSPGVLGDAFLVGQDRLFTVLDPGHLMTLSGLPREMRTDEPRKDAVTGSPRNSYLRCRAWAVDFLVPMNFVSSTIPLCEIDASAVSDGECLGMIRRHGVEMPMLETVALFGFAHDAAPVRQAAGIVLEFDGAPSLALRIDTISDVLRLRPEEIHPFPAVISRRHTC